jgi:hypothetical protein
MTHFMDNRFSSRYLDATLDSNRIRPQDVRTIVSEIAGNPAGFVVAWRHFQMHWEQYLVNGKVY